MPRVLFISHDMRLQGGPMSLFYLAQGLRKKGYDIEVIALEKGEILEKYDAENIKVHIWDPPPEKARASLKEKWFLQKALFFHQNKYDLVFLNTMQTFHFLKIPTLDRKRCIWCIRESERDFLFDVLYKTHSIDMGKLFGAVGRVVFVAEATRKVYEDLNVANNFAVIHNGINLQEIEEYKQRFSKFALKEELGLSAFSSIYLNIGAITKRKGQQYLIDAAIRFLKEKKSGNICFLLVGGTSAFYEWELRKIVSDNSLMTRIFILPETRKIFQYYRVADCFLLSSIYESLPRVILEAMAFELPIISTGVFGVPEEIEDGKSGLLINPKDSDALLEKMNYLDANPAVAAALGKGAYQRVCDLFPLDRMIENYERLFREVMEEKASPHPAVSTRLLRKMNSANILPANTSKFRRTMTYLRDYGLAETIKRARISLALKTLKRSGYPIGPAEPECDLREEFYSSKGESNYR